MEIAFDPDKDAINRRQHGLSLADAERMDFDTALYAADDRYDYGEQRIQALGLIDGRLPMLVFTMRGVVLRAISLRKANGREGSMSIERDPPPADVDENPAWTEADFARAKPFKEGFPVPYQAWKNRVGRPPVQSPKVHIGFRLAADVVDGVRATAKDTTPAWRRCCVMRWRTGCFDRRRDERALRAVSCRKTQGSGGLVVVETVQPLFQCVIIDAQSCIDIGFRLGEYEPLFPETVRSLRRGFRGA